MDTKNIIAIGVAIAGVTVAVMVANDAANARLAAKAAEEKRRADAEAAERAARKAKKSGGGFLGSIFTAPMDIGSIFF